MWNPFKKSIPVEASAPQVHTLSPTVKLEDTRLQVPVQLITPRTVLLKKLKWVTNKGRVGIVAELDTSGYAEVHYTDAAGQTVEVERVNCTALKLARFEEIPEPRRANLSQVYAATLGYF